MNQMLFNSRRHTNPVLFIFSVFTDVQKMDLYSSTQVEQIVDLQQHSAQLVIYRSHSNVCRTTTKTC